MSWSTAVAKPPIFAGEDERALKLRYAALVVQHNGQVSEAAYFLFPGEENYGRAWGVAEHWPHDPIVAFEIRRLLETGEVEVFLPTQAEAAKTIWDKAQQIADAKTALGYFELFAKLMDYLPKQGGNQVNVNLTQNVIEVPSRANEDELPMLEGQWAEQQRQLIADARSSRPS